MCIKLFPAMIGNKNNGICLSLFEFFNSQDNERIIYTDLSYLYNNNIDTAECPPFLKSRDKSFLVKYIINIMVYLFARVKKTQRQRHNTLSTLNLFIICTRLMRLFLTIYKLEINHLNLLK